MANVLLMCCVFAGGEIEANRTHAKREENITGGIVPLPRQTGIRLQGAVSVSFCLLQR